MAKENREKHIYDGTTSPLPSSAEAQQRVEDYVGLCERLITCCESVTLNPIKTGVQA